MLKEYVAKAVGVTPDRPLYLDRFLCRALECEADALSDGKDVFIPAIMQHIELAGIHSGDSACVLPPEGISDKVKESIDNSKATVSQSVITMAKEGASDASIANNLGINKSRVKRIRIENGLLRKRGKSGRIRKANIRAVMMSELREKYTFSEIAEAFGCSRQNVQQIVSAWEVYRRDQG
jgi:transposase-like protein